MLQTELDGFRVRLKLTYKLGIVASLMLLLRFTVTWLVL